MAAWEWRKQVKNGNEITEVTWTWGTSQDPYYWIENSFQYSSNINTDDELHGIKLSNRVSHTSSYAKCQLVSLWEHWVMALPIDTTDSSDPVFLKRFLFNGYYDSTGNERPDWPTDPDSSWNPISKRTEWNIDAGTTYSYKYDAVPWVVFQDRFWFWYNKPASTWESGKSFIASVMCNSINHSTVYQNDFLPYDHFDYTDESIEDPSSIRPDQFMQWDITAILNYNNTRLVVAAWQNIWVYYPELDISLNAANPNYDPSVPLWETWWKKVLTYEAWVTIVGLTCTFEYLKVRAVDEWWNTKVYYYQGNNNLRSTFVYNLIDLTWVRVLHVYSINGIDYYTSSIWEYASDALVDLNKLVGTVPVKLFSQRAGMTNFDMNTKAPYFVWPTSISWAYNNGNIYIADAFWVFSFRYDPEGYDKGYMKWKLRDAVIAWQQVYGLCENKWFLYVSDSTGCRAMRLYDTWVDWYQSQGILISREFEWREWWVITKMLDEVRLGFELNPRINESQYASDSQPYWTIDVYVSPNNLRKDTNPSSDGSDYWYKVISITKDSKWTRTEKSALFNNLQQWSSSFRFDWQTITYAIVITRWSEPRVTPIVRQIDIRYHCKDKIDNVYNIN